MGAVLDAAQPRNTLFTGSQRVAERLALQLKGKVGAGWNEKCGGAAWAELRRGEGWGGVWNLQGAVHNKSSSDPTDWQSTAPL